MDVKKMKLRRMAVWTLAIFATIFAVAFAVLWLLSYPLSSGTMSTLGMVFGSGWPILLLDIVLCAGVYFGYRYYLNRQK